MIFLMVLNMIFYGFEYDVFMVLNIFSYGGKMIYDFFTVVNMIFYGFEKGVYGGNMIDVFLWC